MEYIDNIVQGVMLDDRLTHQERAAEAALQIDRFVRDEFDIAVNVTLPVPEYWRPRIEALA